MKEIFKEEWLRQVLETAKDYRMQQVEEEFAASEDYREAEKVKEELFHCLEEALRRETREVLIQYDDSYGLLMGRAQDFFYERGFTDCFRFLGGTLAQLLEQGRRENNG